MAFSTVDQILKADPRFGELVVADARRSMVVNAR